ncbi:MAG: response regulator [Oligoflexia bacterium]|nr:response regulator [Oligoflexia bacterium]
MENPRSRILLIDDEPAILKLAETILRRAGHSVRATTSAEAALELLVQADPPFACVITDAMMPELSGFDVVRLIRSNPRFAALPVLMLTRKRQAEDVKEALAAGVTDYLVKPIDEHLLIDKVELCLKKGQGKRHVFEFPLVGPSAEARLELRARITSVSESGLTLRLAVPLAAGTEFLLQGALFEEIGIPAPPLKLIQCEPLETTDPLAHEAKLAFVGLPEASLRKIRAWLHRQEALQRR